MAVENYRRRRFPIVLPKLPQTPAGHLARSFFYLATWPALFLLGYLARIFLFFMQKGQIEFFLGLGEALFDDTANRFNRQRASAGFHS